ncbi:MAG TPA: TlyA family RNA methyltransferase [Xanthobacteraceae bacterium]|nr:TlyA family RNA methyltransferase [Xanthobacteraceae bacterium]
MTSRQRADLLLVARGLFDSRAKAQAAIAAGRVTADGATVRKPSEEIARDAAIKAEPAFPWVSRGGVKLAHALDRLAIDVTDRVCLDVGASTGGFTEVLLARGARRVFAVDVGRDQLHARLRGRPDVVSLEETDIRALDAARLQSVCEVSTVPALPLPLLQGERVGVRGPIREHGVCGSAPHPDPLPAKSGERERGHLPSLVTIDASFISLKQVLPAALALAAPRAQLVALIKPQFETGERRALKKGIVRDPAVHAAVCADVAAFVAGLGWAVDAPFSSPIAGHDGNREFFIGARRG